jgi:hypothetical protein
MKAAWAMGRAAEFFLSVFRISSGVVIKCQLLNIYSGAWLLGISRFPRFWELDMNFVVEGGTGSGRKRERDVRKV